MTERWPAIRVRNFLNRLNKRGYTDSKVTKYDNNVKALADHLGITVEVFQTMSPITYGNRAFLPQCAHPDMQQMLGAQIYYELLEEYWHEQDYLRDLKAKFSVPVEVLETRYTADEIEMAGVLMVLVD